MSELYLIKIGEITLKKGNRALFERQLKQNIKRILRPHPTRVTNRSGRFYLETENLPEEYVCDCLSKVFGIVGFTRSYSCPKELDALEEKALLVAQQNIDAGNGIKFKIETRRIDKSLPLDNYGYSAEIGGRVFEKIPGLKVDVKNPDWVIHIELREKGYVYGYTHKGPGGLPVHTGGKGMLLLSGGIDSPVAGYLMAKRGMSLDAVYFHTPPYTSPESLEKVRDLAKIIAPWCCGIHLFTVPFTEVQVQINRSVRPETTTLHSRAAMMKIAQSIAKKRDDLALITGEALSQVASQTLESLAYTNSQVDLPVFRPLIGMDKEETILISRKIKAFETSIQPFDDCCTLFSPDHPEVKPKLKKTQEDWTAIEDIDRLMAEAEEKAEKIFIPVVEYDKD
ncbi:MULTISPECIES: tRNA uracil 4-sulfurtransferase ThiI [unclassified Oceanispirochaeta]|uniref:tRNA uracil 4-sulfurtransferase ThiI n=1 Tax=unclassified Oceanispirochaeta TaxID=2635722 RepID=UPI000E08E034|nr:MULTISPECIES: tRNA uracil 4-sulfurtransferase ThiI [unclassified Oceanispirochaeta]MBF9017796.1 tRNA 4-thiouridine(8) synthase ThiI [Oceanispirochaeta sp. M2]NPD74360.1 tRNA 4-thiouridine(8) synthase ThiI [Oceanispirochaeta sp. M1]RDG29839.1 tRNA 4-thiouridine(8) synthase ThiI [Oceanispirochaeta sp. M1]